MAYADNTKTNLFCKLQVMSGLNQIRRNIGAYSGFYGDLDTFTQTEFDLNVGEEWTVLEPHPLLISCEAPISIEIASGTGTIQSTVHSFAFIDFPVDSVKMTNNSTAPIKIQVIYGAQ